MVTAVNALLARWLDRRSHTPFGCEVGSHQLVATSRQACVACLSKRGFGNDCVAGRARLDASIEREARVDIDCEAIGAGQSVHTCIHPPWLSMERCQDDENVYPVL